MWVLECVCMCVCACVYGVCVFECVCVCRFVCGCSAYMYVYVFVYLYVYAHVCVCVCASTLVCLKCAWTNVCMIMCFVREYTCTNVRLHAGVSRSLYAFVYISLTRRRPELCRGWCVGA